MSTKPTDGYTAFVQNPLGKKVTGALGLPQPTPLKRYAPGQPVVDGPALIIGTSPVAEATASYLFHLGVDVRRDRGLKTRFAGIIVAVDDVDDLSQLSEPILELGASLRQLDKNGRVIIIGRDPQAAPIAGDPQQLGVRQAITGITRSVAHEMRYGSTANGILICDDVVADAPSVMGAISFFLSTRSAYVSGQFLTVTSDAGALPADADQPLAGKTIVVTGAARGIGAAIAEVLARDGAKVVGVDVPAAGEALAQTINRVEGLALQLDITAEDAGEQILRFVSERIGRLDGIVHNAGITRDKLLANMDASRWDSVLAVNVQAPLRINDQLLAARDTGDPAVAGNLHIVSLASTSGIAGNRGQTNYAASKAGIIGFTQAYADRLATNGGSINAVAPGFIETDMTAKMPTLTREVGRRVNSLSQGGLPVDVAEAIGFLLSDQSAGINGRTLRVCGQAVMGA
ncbi:3-oxoacyl-ACP reductase [Auritidibacter ignavus]|uniref:3-oxoacyl-ACP reductase n=1 Tax=Auritidibacter ignavus TaxID=678932 RepID=UPI00244BAAB6|nr:3-oxoacyl-ACP reductase [Auritidibacter ignavus]WGH82117.1 3-oxoacyl-ACP reductase [Auritidibacter ignavus]